MNEQLTVKNFGPIKDATVDFKRVTVFIGPTGGGKSTLAKLAAVFSDKENFYGPKQSSSSIFDNYNLHKYYTSKSYVRFGTVLNHRELKDKKLIINDFDYDLLSESQDFIKLSVNTTDKVKILMDKLNKSDEIFEKEKMLLMLNDFLKIIEEVKTDDIIYDLYNTIFKNHSLYIPSERIFISTMEYSWAGIMRDDIGLPKTLLDFANEFSLSRKDVSELYIPFLSVKYLHIDGRDFIKIPEREEPLMLLETASGIQSVTPMLVLLEHLSRQKEQAQSFIIEEPELNLYPTVQQGLMNWLIEKCTKGENDLTITTHSPYILSHLNLLLFAYQVAENHPDRADDVAKVVPRESWINPKEFACYHVEGQKENGVHSIVNPETGLISYNDLDALAGNSATEFDQLLDINAGLEVE